MLSDIHLLTFDLIKSNYGKDEISIFFGTDTQTSMNSLNKIFYQNKPQQLAFFITHSTVRTRVDKMYRYTFHWCPEETGSRIGVHWPDCMSKLSRQMEGNTKGRPDLAPQQPQMCSPNGSVAWGRGQHHCHPHKGHPKLPGTKKLKYIRFCRIK
jgi:hypothetical protein